MHRGAHRAADRLAERGRTAVADHPDGAATASVRGYLHLRSAILASRLGDRQGADAHLDEAAEWRR